MEDGQKQRGDAEVEEIKQKERSEEDETMDQAGQAMADMKAERTEVRHVSQGNIHESNKDG